MWMMSISLTPVVMTRGDRNIEWSREKTDGSQAVQVMAINNWFFANISEGRHY